MSDEYTFNIAECWLWLVIALILLIKSWRDAMSVRSTLRILAFAFCLFGLSDYIEAHTGAWWKPLWLLFLKGACIVIFVWGRVRCHRLTKR